MIQEVGRHYECCARYTDDIGQKCGHDWVLSSPMIGRLRHPAPDVLRATDFSDNSRLKCRDRPRHHCRMTSPSNIRRQLSALAAADQYTYRLTWSPEDNEHVGLCAEFPSLSWLDATPDGALNGIQKVVAEVLAEMQMRGEAVTPSHSHR